MYDFGSSIDIQAAVIHVRGSLDVINRYSMLGDDLEDRSYMFITGWEGVFMDDTPFHYSVNNAKMLMQDHRIKCLVLSEVNRINARHTELLQQLVDYCEVVFDGMRGVDGASKDSHIEAENSSPFAQAVKQKTSPVVKKDLPRCLEPFFRLFMDACAFRVNGMGVSPISLTVYEDICKMHGIVLTPYITKLFSSMDGVFLRVFSKGA